MFIGEARAETKICKASRSSVQAVNCSINTSPPSTSTDARISTLQISSNAARRKTATPLQEEQEACMDWLRNQTALLRPKIIVCLGRIAAMRITIPNFKITREHGQVFQKGNIYMTATLHPAALLRNPAQKPAAFDDFLKLRDKIDELQADISKTY